MIKPRRFIFLWMIAFVILLNSFGFSQSLQERSNFPRRMGHGKREMKCWRVSELELSSEKQKELQLIQQTFFKETQLLRAQLFTKRLELREMLTNPAIREEVIRPKYLELAEIQAKLEERIMEYLIKIRSFFASEQLPFWCPEEEFPFYPPMRERHGPMKPMGHKSPWKTD